MDETFEVFLLYLLPLVISGLVALFLAYDIARNRRRAEGGLALSILMVATAVWSISYALEIANPDLAGKLFWAKIQYLGIVAIPPTWAIFSAQYKGSPGWLARSIRNQILLGIIPGLTLFLIWTNETHRLVWHSVGLRVGEDIQILAFDHGPWFWFFWIFSYALLFAGSAWMAVTLLGSNRLKRRQVFLSLIAVWIPWIGNLVFSSPLHPTSDIDWTPLGFTIAGLLFALSLFRYHLADLLPIARKVVFEKYAQAIFVLDSKDRITDFNPTAEHLLVTSRQKILGLFFAQALPNLASLLAGIDRSQVIRTEATLNINGDLHYYDLLITPLFDRDSTPIGRLAVFQDVTQRKQQQIQLQKAHDELETRVSERTEELKLANERLLEELKQRTLAEKRFHTIVEFAPDAMLLIDQNDQIVLANAQAEYLFGNRRVSLCHQSIWNLFPDRFHDQFPGSLAGNLSNFVARSIDLDWNLYGLCSDGSEFPIEIRLSPLETAEGSLVACIIRDIRERKQAELALQESEKTYRVLFENASDAIFLVNREAAILKANQKAANLLEYTQQELEGMTLKDILSPEEYLKAINMIEAVLTGKIPPTFDRNLYRKSGEIVTVEINLAVVRDGKDKPKFIQSIVRDITERKKAEQEQVRLVQKIRRSRGQMRALAARLQDVREVEQRQIASELHDRVGQNLTGLSLNLQIVQNQLSKNIPTSVQSRLNDSLKLVEETTRQVRDVMADLNPPLLDEYGLLSALRWCAGIFFQRTGIDVQVIGEDIDPRLPQKVEIVLFRIVQEALTNVIKHAQANRVHVIVKSFNNCIRLKIKDDGLGFDPSILNSASQEPHWGILTMQERAASVGGSLTIQSAPGKGTSVSIKIKKDLI